ncbi:hypothetical protein, partial [Alicyclobacillus cellulosilyticus]|uniref:hypothetical protein n=1 Tax=Alicyclobacillus cellulosilyticus TaxID=1003997 RepID=UPI00166A9FF7
MSAGPGVVWASSGTTGTGVASAHTAGAAARSATVHTPRASVRHAVTVRLAAGKLVAAAARTAKQQAALRKAPAGSVIAQVAGKPWPAIAVGDETYVLWTALKAFGTPYAYLGDGRFSLPGRYVQGVVYKGQAYLPWSVLAPKVKAEKLPGGGFNFTAVPVTHRYQLAVDAMDGVAGNLNDNTAGTQANPSNLGAPGVLVVQVLDGNQWVPHQAIQVHISGNGFLANYGGQYQVTTYTDENGSAFFGVNDETPESVKATVTWKDPAGTVHEYTTDIRFSAPNQQTLQIPLPSDETDSVTVPITTFSNAVLFNAWVKPAPKGGQNPQGSGQGGGGQSASGQGGASGGSAGSASGGAGGASGGSGTAQGGGAAGAG